MISETVVGYPQEIYAAVVRAIQSEWIFLQHVIKNMRYAFTGVDKLLQETFLPGLFLIKPKSLPSIVGTLSTFPVKKYGPGLQNPVMSVDEKFLILQRAST